MTCVLGLIGWHVLGAAFYINNASRVDISRNACCVARTACIGTVQQLRQAEESYTDFSV